MTSWTRRIRRLQRGDEHGFALLAALAIMLMTGLIVVALTGYALNTVTFANAQAARDQATRAGDGALDTVLNQLVSDHRGDTSLTPTTSGPGSLLGSVGSPCTPTKDATTTNFVVPIGTNNITVSCTPQASNDPPVAVAGSSGDTVDILANGSDTEQNKYLGKIASTSPTCPAVDGVQYVCPDWQTALTSGGIATAASSYFASYPASLLHSGNSPLFFTADDVAVATGAAALRSPQCAASVTDCSAIGVAGTYRQGYSGAFSTAAGAPTTAADCGALSPTSSVPSARVTATSNAQVICGNTAVRGLSYRSSLVPSPPIDPTSGDVIGSVGWVASHTVTYLAAPGANSTSTALWTALGPIASQTNCPAGESGKLISFVPGAYTKDATAVLSRWFSRSGCANKVFWFKPGIYWFDMDDATATYRNAIQFADYNSFYVFGQPPSGDRNALLAMTDATATPLCDSTEQGVSISLSQRTSIRHTKGRVAICGTTGLPTLYQSAGGNDGWTGVPGTVAGGGTSSFTSNIANIIARIFGQQISFNTPITSIPFNVSAPCNLAILGGCEGDVAFAASSFGNPGSAPINSASVQITGDSPNANDDSNGNASPTTRIDVFLSGNTSGTPTCSVTYKKLVTGGNTDSYNLLDSNFTTPGQHSCVGLITDRAQLAASALLITMHINSDCGLFGCNYGLNISNASIRASWNPVIDPSKPVTCTGCVNASTTSKPSNIIERNSDLDVVSGVGDAQFASNCSVTAIAGGTLNSSCAASSMTGTFGFSLAEQPGDPNLAQGNTPAALTYAALQLKGTSFCTRVTGALQFSGATCGPLDATAPTVGSQNPISNTNPGSYNRWRNWEAAANGSGAKAVVTITQTKVADGVSPGVICTATMNRLPEWDETRELSLQPGVGACSQLRYADQLIGASVSLTLTMVRSGDCSDGILSNGCTQWGYDLDWAGFATTSGTDPTTAYSGPPTPFRFTSYKNVVPGATTDATFNVLGNAASGINGQVVLPRAAVDIDWGGPITAEPLVVGPAPNGQPTLIVSSLGSAERPQPSSASSATTLANAPVVGVVCCEPYRIRSRHVVLRAWQGTTLLATATVEILDYNPQSRTFNPGSGIKIDDWELCNRPNGTSASPGVCSA